MKKFFKILIWIIVVLAAIILIGGAFMPSKTEVSVTKNIDSEVFPVFVQVNCLKANSNWSPWENVADIQYSGPECGKGATMTWKDDMGSGKQVITASQPFELIKTSLDFGEQGTAVADLFFKETDKGTQVTWTFESDASYPIGRWMSTLLIKPMIKKSYVKGLKNLDSVMTNMPDKKKTKIQYEQVESVKLISMQTTVTTEEIPTAMQEIFTQLGIHLGENQIQPAGPPLTIWHEWSDAESTMEVGFPIEKNIDVQGEISTSKTYAGPALTIMHKGSYDKSHEAWEKLMNSVGKAGLKPAGAPWEVYLTDPQTEKDTTKWKTKLYQPVKNK